MAHLTTRPPAIRRYARLALAVYVLALLFSAGNVARQNLDIRHCNGRGHTEDRYIHACPGATFAHYGHGAVFYGLEPGIHDAIREARILFLGTSRMMWGFSTDAVEKSLRQSGVPYFLMGFGHAERYRFAQPLLQKLEARPAVTVINIDPYFSETLTPLGKEVAAASPATVGMYWLKRQVMHLHRDICQDKQHPWYKQVCGTRPTLYASSSTGRWYPRSWPDKKDHPVKPNRRRKDMRPTALRARRFFRETGIDPACTIFTVVPSSRGPGSLFARRLAQLVGARYKAPSVKGLRTWDGSHLTRESAERWSGAFMETFFDDRVKACLDRAPTAPRGARRNP